MPHATESLSQQLKAARKAKGISQHRLSALAGVPQSHISKIESNEVDLRASSLLALAHALELELTLVPRKALPAIEAIISQWSVGSGRLTDESGPRPAYRLEDSDD